MLPTYGRIFHMAEDLYKKLNSLLDLIKNYSNLLPSLPESPQIKPPKINNQIRHKKQTKIPGVAPDSKKDPRKVAEQIKNGAMSIKTQKILFKNDDIFDGWSSPAWDQSLIEKVDNTKKYRSYHIHQDGYKITDKPMSLMDINKKYGSVNYLESLGFTLVPAEDIKNEHKEVQKLQHRNADQGSK